MILITGGAGYIGSHINKRLNKENRPTIICDNLSQGHKELVKWGKLIEGDIGDIDTLEKIFREHKIDAVYHFAALASVPDSVSDPEKYYLNNVASTLNLLKMMRIYGVKKIVFSSSAATFGSPQYVPIDENHPQIPINPYGMTKLMMEKILNDFDKAYGIKYVILRYFNASGADPDGEIGEWHEPEGHLIPLILDAALGKRQEVKIYGTDYQTKDGSCVRDYIHVTDLADIHVRALDYLENNKDSQMFNLGNGNGFSVKEIINIAKKVTGISIKVEESERRPGDPAILIATSDKVKKVLAWKPRYNDIKIIIETAWNWHRKLYKKYKK